MSFKERIDEQWFKRHPVLWLFNMIATLFLMLKIFDDLLLWLKGQRQSLFEYALAGSVGTGIFIGTCWALRRKRSTRQSRQGAA
jgi:hypothetical protein